MVQTRFKAVYVLNVSPAMSNLFEFFLSTETELWLFIYLKMNPKTKSDGNLSVQTVEP